MDNITEALPTANRAVRGGTMHAKINMQWQCKTKAN